MDRFTVLSNAKRIVIKVGSAVLTNETGLDYQIIGRLSAQIARLIKEGREIALVSSGAVAAGRGKLPQHAQSKTVPEKQALAAVGQGRLMHAYEEAFDRFGLTVAQVLLTRDGIIARNRYLNAKNTLLTLLNWNILPIINENDTVATEELQFTDNDALSVIVLNLVEAELFVCLSDTDGLYNKDPREHTDAKLVTEVKTVDDAIMSMAGVGAGRAGRGGMKSKLRSARMATSCGLPMLLAGGRTEDVLTRIFKGEQLGTFFHAETKRTFYGKKPWIAFALSPEASLTLDAGAINAVTQKNKSLLAVGVKAVHGEFEAETCVSLQNEDGVEVAIGVTAYASDELKKIIGCKSSDICELLGYDGREEVIHRDDMVVWPH